MPKRVTDGRFVVAADGRTENPPSGVWFLMKGFTWTREYANAIRFETLRKAASVLRIVIDDSARPRGDRFELPLVVFEDYGLTTERLHEIG